MSAMYKQYVDMLKEETLQSTQSMENWLRYIDGASRNYKYGFSEQLLINNQKPDATAIADYETWRDKLGRVIKTGTAMYLPVNVGGKLTVKNYFDVADTIVTKNSLPIPQWGYSSEHEQSVREGLLNQYGLPGVLPEGGDLGEILDLTYDGLFTKYFNENVEAINSALEGSGLFTADMYADEKYMQQQIFETAVYASTALITNKRLGIRSEYNDILVGFIEPNLHFFNTEDSINALGNAASSLSEEYLRTIEVAVKSYDKEQQKIKERELNEQGVHSGSDKQHGLLRAADQAGVRGNDRADASGRYDTQQVGIQRPVVRDGLDGQKRPNNQDAISQHSNGRGIATVDTLGHSTDGLLEETQEIHGGANGNSRPTQTLPGDRGTGRNTEEINDGSLSQEPDQQSHGAGQGRGPDSMGRQNEQLSGESTRNNQQRPDLRINREESSETPVEASIDMGAFSMQKIPPMFVIDWDEAQNDFDLNLYEDGDMVAYNKDGVSFKVGKVGEYNFITSTTSITPVGDILGDIAIPDFVREQMRAYRNGDITADQVRAETLQRLEMYKPQPEVEISQQESEVLAEETPREYPVGVSHSPLLKGWYDAFEQDEELTYNLARGFNKMLSDGLTITSQDQFEAAFEKMSAPILQQSKLTDAAFKVLGNKNVTITGQQSIGYGSLGNGTTFWDRLNENPETRDYYSLAHISEEGEISWRVADDYFPDEHQDYFKGQIENYADSIKHVQITLQQQEPAEVKIGDVLLMQNKQWLVEAINSDFSIKLKNVDPSDTQAGQIFMGRWREKLDEIGFSIVIPQSQNTGSVGFAKTLTRPTKKQVVNDMQLSLDSFEEIDTPNNSAPIQTSLQGTPIWQDYQTIASQHSNHVLFYRLGDFYEVLGDNAPNLSETLNVSLTSRDVGLEERAPMFGVPQHTLENYLAILADKGIDVVVRHGQGEIEVKPAPQKEMAIQHPSGATEKVVQTLSPLGNNENDLLPNVDKLLSEGNTDYYLLHFPEGNKNIAELSRDTLSLITEATDNYVICADVLALSEEQMKLKSGFLTFRKMPRDWNLLPKAAQVKMREMRPDIEQQWRDDNKTLHSLINLDHETLNSHDGHQDCQIQAFLGDKQAGDRIGVVNYSVLDGKPLIVNIEVDEHYRREGIATSMISYLANQFPNANIGWGALTDDGAALKESINNAVNTIMIAEPPQGEPFDWTKTVDEIAKDTANYIEPFVVIEFMEGGLDRAFNRMDRLTFREADVKFKEIERAFRSNVENMGYDKTFGAVLYKENPEDTELSVYGFRYDVGDYDEERSGLYNHINNYWCYIEEAKTAKPDAYSHVSDESIANAKKMLGVLADYVDVVHIYKPQVPNRTPQIGDEVYHGGVLHRLDGIDGIMIKLYNLETNNVAAMITTKERFFEGLQEDERNRHLFFQNVQSDLPVIHNADTTKSRVDKLNEAVSGIVGRVQPLPKFPTLEAVEAELDRKIGLMADSPDFEKIKEAVGYWKNWRTMSHRVGIATNVLVNQINEFDDAQAVEWFAKIPWDNWREALDIGDFELLSHNIRHTDNKQEKEEISAAKNFRLDNIDYESISAGGAKSKFKRNIEAIRTLQAIEADGRRATLEEQEILAHYVGWGGVADAFNARNEQWSAEHNELKELLTHDEYNAARASVLTAYYTEPTIMNAMWDKVEELGRFENYGDNLKNVNILEPSAGVGNFLGVMPEHIGTNANVHAVELDSISGRIAKQLYPAAKIQIRGFEKTLFQNDMFDVVVGNVPFSESIKPVDWQYDKDNFLIHDYFFNKALDKVRPGGVVAFITSAGTLDKADDKARIMMAEKAELLGAIRLPNNAFKANAGTEVVSDIIFLQKREEPLDLSLSNIIPDELDWVHSIVTRVAGKNPKFDSWQNTQLTNSYFVDNPHMVLGENTTVTSQYGLKDTIMPIEGADLGEQLRTAMTNIVGVIPVRNVPETDIDEEEHDNYFFYSDEKGAYQKSPYENEESAWIYEDIKNNAFAVIDDKVYFRTNHRLDVVNAPATTLERIKGMVSLRNVLRDIIQAQVDDRPDIEITNLQNELNIVYDNFSKQYGLITSNSNGNAFDKDDSYYLLTSLEKLNDELEFEGKSDIFTKRTIKPHIEITSVDTSAEALGVSIGYRGQVDLNYMAELTGFDKDRIINDLRGVIFLEARYHYDENNNSVIEANSERYVTADEYLSGNVRVKLENAKKLAVIDPRFETNVAALEIAQPAPLEAHEIYVRVGTTWIDKGYVQQFMNEILETPNSYSDEIGEDGKRTSSWVTDKQAERDRITVQYSKVTNEWRVTNKNIISGTNIKASVEYGTGRINAYHILEQTLNLKEVVVKDKVIDHEGKERDVVNEEETVLAKQKQEDLKVAFREWIFKNPVRRETLVATYNERFNSTRPREYDGSHITFGGMNAEIKLEPHQVNAVARVMYGGNTLLAHEVGAGKSFEMIAAAMEAKRIGLCSKSLIVVPKHLTGQMASEFLRLYPNANILVATDKTFEPKNRKKFCAKIATGNYDAIIMGHTQFEMIPLSKENQERYYKEQFEQLVNAISEAKAADSGYFTVKQMENTKNKVKLKLDNLYKDDRKDDVITFEQLGVDKIFVDESHSYKNLHLYTKMRNVAGISQTEAQKSADMFMKCRYLDEETGSKGVVFATGTPISNSLTEMYTVQRYLQYETLQDLNLHHFDQWASIFTEPTSDMELAPEGGGYRLRTRCAKFQNLPELMNTFFEVADIKTAETLNLPRPKANFHTISCEPTQLQKTMVQGLSERADKVRSRAVHPTVDNMLAITNDGRKLGLDQRVINPDLPDDPNSKINAATENIFNIWDKTKADRLTQVVFCDLSTPSARNKKEHGFNVYDDIKQKLIDRGIPENEIAFVHDYNSDKQKQKLFAQVRSGTIRVVFGSTEKMGAGTNIQDKLIALHSLDCPWRPSDLAQREGRILRRGNSNPEIDIYKYVTKDTFDAYLYQTIEKKQQFISQIMTEKSPVRTVDDVDQSVLDYAEIKALCVGNPKIKEKMDLEHDLKKLTALQAQYKKNLYRMENSLMKHFPAQITAKERNIENYIADEQRLAKGTVTVGEGISPMVVDGITYNERVKAGEAVKSACKSVDTTDGVKVGTYRGFELHLSFDKFGMGHRLTVRGDMSYPIKLEGNFSTQGVVTRIDNALDKISEYIKTEKDSLENTKIQVETAKIEVAKPFPQEEEMKEKTARVTQLSVELSLDAQKVQASEIDVDEAIIDNYDIEHDADENTTEIIYEHQNNVVDSMEAFDVTKNDGKSAYVGGNVFIDEFAEKTASKPGNQLQHEGLVNKNIANGMIMHDTTKSAATSQQPTEQPKPVKKRNYHEI